MLDSRSSGDITTLLHFINRFLVPLVPLTTEAEVARFLDLQQEPIYNQQLPQLGEEYSRLKYPTRALALIYDVEEYDEELNYISYAA